MSKNFIYKYLNEDELKSIADKIGEIEKTTSGELVITIKEKRSWLERKKSVRALAENEFIDAKIAQTKDATGILIFIVIGAKEFCILADKNINSKVKQSVWDEIISNMSMHFKQENFCSGILEGINRTGKILEAHFPIQPDDVNELPNEVRVK